MANSQTTDQQKPQQTRARRVATTCVLVVVLVFCTALLIYSLLCVFLDGFYPTFGGYRLMAIVSDSMEPEIPTGNMIVTRVPESSDEIQVGTVITFEVKNDGVTYLLTHRVTEVHTNEETGEIAYTTKGDNAAGADRIMPTYDEVVGIYTGRKCGVFGYIFGFLQSSQGAIALIVIVLIIILMFIILWFIDAVNTWRRIATEAIEKSKTLLAGTESVEGHTVADVLGIVIKDPKDRQDLKRKNKKLRWFMRTGLLPRRPYRDDIDEYNEQIEHLQLTEAAAHKEQSVQETPSAENIVATAPETVVTDKVETPPAADTVETPPVAPASPDITDSIQEVAAAAAPAEYKFERKMYDYSFRARLIQNKPDSKEFYSIVKNALLSYNGIATIDSKSCERYVVARKTVARVKLSGKTLCVLLALDPERFADSKYRVLSNKSNTPAKLKITSERQARYCAELIDQMMGELGAVKNAKYEPQDFYMPYEGIASLMSKGLVKRKKTQTPRVSEECERMSYDLTFSARLTQLAPECKDWYSLVKNELLSYSKVRLMDGKRGETYMIGRKTVAKINVRGKTVCLLLALDPKKYADAKYKVNVLNNPKTPLKYRLSSENRTQYALELIADLMAGEAAEKNAEYVPQDFRPSYENIVALMNKGLAKRKLTNKTQVFAVELVKKE